MKKRHSTLLENNLLKLISNESLRTTICIWLLFMKYYYDILFKFIIIFLYKKKAYECYFEKD